MRKNILIMAILGACMADGAMAKLPPFDIGYFTAPKGADGTNGTNGTNGVDGCPPLISQTTKANGCYQITSQAQKRVSGSCTLDTSASVETLDTVCDCRPTETRRRCAPGTSVTCGDTTRGGVEITTTQCDGSQPSVSYIYDNNCGITVASVADVHQDNDSTKPVTHKRVTFKDCNNNILSTTADVPVGCTPTYTQKYINKIGNSTTYNNASRTESTIGTRVTVSGCGAEAVNIDTYDGDDGTSFNYMGTVANCNALNSISNPAQNDAYIVNGDGNGKLCIYNGSAWPTCPSGCAEFTGPAGDNNCTGLESSETAVKHTLRSYSAPSGGTTSGGVTVYANRGKMVLTHKMCNTNLNDTVDNENDLCTPIIKPSGVACNGTYHECKRSDNSNVYNLCEATTGTTIESVLSGKEDTACTGSYANASDVERKKTVAYSAPGGSGSYGTYSWKTTVGKVQNKSVACSGAETVISSTPDKCEEVARPNVNVCAGTGNVYYECTQQDDNATKYNLCASGISVLNKIDAAQSAADSAASAASAANPCNGLTAGTTAAKTTVQKTVSSYETVTNGIGRMKLERTMCDTSGNKIDYVEDKCTPIVDTRTGGTTCKGANQVYLECVNQTKQSTDTGYKYNVCQTITGTSLANKIDSKADASAVTASALETTLGNTYLKPTDNISASNLTGTIDAGRLPNTVVTTTTLGTAVQTEVENQIHDAELVSQSDLGDYVKTSGTDDNSISSVLQSNNVVMTTDVGSCTTLGSPQGKVASFNCTGALATLFDALAPVINAAADGNTVSRQQ